MIAQGRNAMPAFRQFQPRELHALSAFLKTAPGKSSATLTAGRTADRYTIDGYPLFLDRTRCTCYFAAMGHAECHRSHVGRFAVASSAW